MVVIRRVLSKAKIRLRFAQQGVQKQVIGRRKIEMSFGAQSRDDTSAGKREPDDRALPPKALWDL
jgi:hypothetical protein